MTQNNLPTIDLKKLHQGIYALTTNWSGVLEEAAIFRLEEQGHPSGTKLKVDGEFTRTFLLNWGYTTSDEIRRCYQDEDQLTEWAACGIALLLVVELTEYTAITRSRKGTGFDYWLGYKQDAQENIFKEKARLEVSGLRSAKEVEIVKRLREKIQQTTPSDSTGLPAYAIVVEFSRPVSRIKRK